MIDNESACDAKIPSWKYEDIERRVTKLYEEQSINRLPIDPFEIVKKRGYMPIPFSAFEKAKIFDGKTIYEAEKDIEVLFG